MELPIKRFIFPREHKVGRIKKKAKFDEFYILIVGIFENFSISSDLFIKKFIPELRSKNIGIAFFTFQHQEKRLEFIKYVVSEYGSLMMYSYEGDSVMEKNSSANQILDQLKLIKKLSSDWVELFRKGQNSKYEKNYKELEQRSRDYSFQCLASISLSLESLLFFTNARDTIDIAWTTECFLVHLLFGLSCCMLFKSEFQTNTYQLKLFKFLLTIEHINLISDHMKVLFIDMFYQIVFLKGQFYDEKQVFDYICNCLGESEKKLSLDFQLLHSKILDIFLAGHSKISFRTPVRDFKRLIESFLSKVYFTEFPESLRGFTCMDSSIFIKFPVQSDKSFSNLISEGFLLLTLLHEFGHFLQRCNMVKKSEWFNFETPLNVLAGRVLNQKTEGESEFMKKIFNHEPFSISYAGAKFVMNIENWKRLSKKEFIKKFSSDNRKGSRQKRKEFQTIRLMVNSYGNTGTIYLGDCFFQKIRGIR